MRRRGGGGQAFMKAAAGEGELRVLLFLGPARETVASSRLIATVAVE
jgi:hypothetical protein